MSSIYKKVKTFLYKLFIIGIEFYFETFYEKIIYDLLKNVDFKDFYWNVCEQEIYYENDEDKELPQFMKNEELEKEINGDSNYYVFFLNIRGYKKNIDLKQIESYRDFLESNCDLILLFVDNSYVEIYSKSDVILKQIIKNCEDKNIKWHEKTPDNDGRTTMYVF